MTLFCFTSNAQNNRIVYSQAKLYLKSRSQLELLHKAGIDFDHGIYDNQTKTFINSFLKADLPKIKTLGIKYDVLVDDELSDFLRRNNPADFYKYSDPKSTQPAVSAKLPFQTCTTNWSTSSWTTPDAFTSGSIGGYYSLSEMEAKLDDMATNYPTLVSKFSIGTTVEGRTIWCVKISDIPGTDESEPEVLYSGLHHAREAMSMHNLIFFMQYILQNYSSDSRISNIINNRELFFVPCVNPDGWNYNCVTNPTGGGMHRKNRRNVGGQTNVGIDLNRNYSVGFAEDNTGSSPNIENDTYRGPSAFSENETQAMRAFINGRRFKLVLNYHAYGQLWVRPPGSASTTATTTDNLILNTAGGLFTKYNCYEVGDDMSTVGYNVNGYSDDWLLSGDAGSRAVGYEKIYGFSPEVSPALSGGTFWPSSSQIIPIAREMMFSNFQVANTSGQFFEVEDNTSPSVTSLTGNFTFRLTRSGLVDMPATVEIIPLQNIASVGSSVNVSSVSAFGGTATGNISYTLAGTTPNQQILKFVWKVTSDGMIFTDTVTKIYNPSELFTDDMEGTYATKWTASGTSNTWGFGTTAAFNGTKSMSESPSGNYSSSRTWYSTCNTTLNLTGCTDAFLSFWLKSNSENCYDLLRVEVSLNGGAYAPVCGSNTIDENRFSVGDLPSYTGLSNGWRREIVDLSSYIGSSNVRFRFLFSSNSSTVSDGFSIDDVVVLKGSLSSTLDVNFVRISAKAEGKTAIINWEAVADTDHAYFVIERSADGNVFTETGRNYNTGYNFSYNDLSPLYGRNVYRVKAISKNGKVQYSNTVSVKFANTRGFRLYPNPAKEKVTVEFFGVDTNEQLIIQLTDISGRVISSEKIISQASNFNYQIKTASLTQGFYILKITDSKAETLYKERIVIQ
ncbi:M14 family zinc carboxypeptidase [Lacibacter luteus]|uniref:M14 family zinc carboxypeptidase n=1 Tax=Lacibacter luteus TaxID=2508719 RepID=UPI0013E964D5|nr:M14 family zinc carboxypeptidase [Lacibacter luteus]